MTKGYWLDLTVLENLMERSETEVHNTNLRVILRGDVF